MREMITYTRVCGDLTSDILKKGMMLFLAKRMKARTVAGRGGKRLPSDDGSEIRLGREKEE